MESFQLRRIALANAGNLGGGSGPLIDASALPALLKAYQDVRTRLSVYARLWNFFLGGGAEKTCNLHIW